MILRKSDGAEKGKRTFSGEKGKGISARFRRKTSVPLRVSADEVTFSAVGVLLGTTRRVLCYLIDSSNSLIQSFFLRTSRAFAPSGGPTIPSFSIKSINRAARP